ncbi:MAG: hypothetical protein ACLP1X_18980 [Polyangiaceae bacterium]
MTRKHALAVALFSAACAALGTACGVSEGGLGGAAIDASGLANEGDAGLGGDGGVDFLDDAASGPDTANDAPEPGDDAAQGDAPQGAPDDASQEDAAQGDATLGEGGPSEGGSDGGLPGEAGSGLDAAPDARDILDAAADRGPVGDAAAGLDGGSHDGGGTPDAGDAGTADAASPDAATTCDFAGTWGSKLVIDVSWTPQGITGILLASGNGTITQWILSTRTLNGDSTTESAVACGIDLPDFDGTAIAGGEVYGVRFPDSLFDNGYLPAFAINGTFSGSLPGATYNTSAAAVLLGLTLTNPTTAPWPATITTEVDMDQDGEPGVTANTLQGNGYTYPPVDVFETNRADELYLAIRQVTQLSATATDCNTLTGTVSIPTITSGGTSKSAIDSHVIGCRIAGTTTNCNSTQWSFVDNTQPVFAPSGGSSFASMRMANGSTCANVRQALP